MNRADSVTNTRFGLACPQCPQWVEGRDLGEATKLVVQHAIRAHGRAKEDLVHQWEVFTDEDAEAIAAFARISVEKVRGIEMLVLMKAGRVVVKP